MAATTLARQHIEEIRTVKFSIGGEPNPLTEDLHHAVRSLSAELYTKDVHFLMELIQNAEDNAYPAEVDPSLEFVIISQDITRTGALATLLVFNNEVGFSKRNIESICSVGRSTKKGRRREGFVGEKGNPLLKEIESKNPSLVYYNIHTLSQCPIFKIREDGPTIFVPFEVQYNIVNTDKAL